MKITKNLAGIVLPVVAMYLIKTGTMIIYKNRIKLIKKDESKFNAKLPKTFDPVNIPAKYITIQSNDELSATDTISCEE